MFKDLLLRGAYSHVSYMSSLTALRLPSSPSWLNAHPACVCLLRHSSLLAEGRRKQHKLSIQLHAPQTILHDMRTYAMIKSPFILRLSPILSLLRAVGPIFPQLYVVLRERQLGLCTELYCCSFSAQWHSPTVMTAYLSEPMYNIANDKPFLMVLELWFVARLPHHV